MADCHGVPSLRVSLSIKMISGEDGRKKKKLPMPTEQNNSGYSTTTDVFQNPAMIYFQKNLWKKNKHRNMYLHSSNEKQINISLKETVL